MKLYKPTFTLRTTLKQEAVMILPPDPEGPEGSYREVQILVPDGPKALFAIDVPVQEGFNKPIKGGIGVNRLYHLSELPAATRIKFRLLPNQFITAGCEKGLSFVSLIVEHCHEGG